MKGNCTDISSRSWGQYSLAFQVPSDIDTSIPEGCEATFVSLLSRHGARDPTSSKTEVYGALIDRIQHSVSKYGPGFEFLTEYEYSLGSEQLTPLGEQQMVDLGTAFYERYKSLAEKHAPFVRASGSQRVEVSAQNFTQGLYAAAHRSGEAPIEDILVIPEKEGVNNTLNHGSCERFEDGPWSDLGTQKQNVWRDTWAPGVRDRLNSMLPGASLTLEETIYMMDLCPFGTVANDDAALSDFCRLFTREEWGFYDYFASLEKWYGYGPGNHLGPTQGVGYVNELVARLTGKPVEDGTTTNSTLDSSPETFPLGTALYADFSHDNTMTSVYGALGLYSGTADLPPERRLTPREAGGYSAAWTVPFGGHMLVEKMHCGDAGGEELVRVLVNGRVVPLQNCKADTLGRCTLSAFVESLGFARQGGRWGECAPRTRTHGESAME